MTNEVISLMQGIYFDDGSARAALLRIGYPPERIPVFRSADTFWPDVVLRLERGIIADGIVRLLSVAAADNPGSPLVAELLARAQAAASAFNAWRSPHKVLALFANPVPGSAIRLSAEKRLLDEIAARGGLEIVMRHAVRVTDIIKSLIDAKPDILHFGGHGTTRGELVFDQDDGSPGLVGPAALAAAIGASAAEKLACVVLNSCFTAKNAEAFRDVTQGVAGSVVEIEDKCALAFTRGFYTGLQAGQNVSDAFHTGRAEMQLNRCDTSGLHFVPFT